MLSGIIPAGEWLPDQSSYSSNGAAVATNVYVDGETYRPVKSLSEISDELGAKCFGAYSYLDPNGNVTTFAGTRTKLYKLATTSWEDITNTGGDYTGEANGVWNFTQFGNRVIATNYIDKIQSFVVGSDTEFSDLITSGPDVKCRNLAVVNNFLVLIDIIDQDGPTQNRVRWSPINDPAGNYTPSQSTQADYQDLEDGAPGQGVAVIGSQNYGIVKLQNAIYRMEYVGPPAIFSFSLVEQNRGPINGNCVASDGVRTFYYAEDGFYLFDGIKSIPIGHKRVDKWFRDNLNETHSHNMRATIDPINKNFLLAFTSNDSQNSRNDKTIVYNWVDNRFTLLNIATDILFRSFTDGMTLEEIGAIYPDIETVPYSFDSRFWVGGETQLAGITSNDKLAYFEGENLTGTIETQETRLNPDGLSYVDSVLPVFLGGSVQCRIGHRMLQNTTVNYTSYVSPSSITGECNFTNESRYQRVGVKLTGDWQQFRGVRYQANIAGGI